MAKEEHAIVEGLMGDSQSPYPMCSSATCSTTLSQTTENPSHEDLSSPQSSYLGHTRLQDQPYTHTASQSASPELKPLSLTPDGTIGPPRYTDAIDDRTARRWPPPATPIASASSTQTSSQRYKPKSVTFSRPSIALELAGYKPEDGPSPPLADQATAQRVYRGIKQHISDQRKSHTDTNGHLDRTRAVSAAKRQPTRTPCVKLAALNAEAAQDLRAAELALGISPGKGKGGRGRGLARDRSKPMFDNSAWQTSPNGPAHGHAQRSPLRTGYQSREVVETASVQRRHGQREGEGREGREGRSRSCVSSIESVCGSQSSPRSMQTQMQVQIPKPKPKPTGYYDYARPRRSNVAVLTISS